MQQKQKCYNILGYPGYITHNIVYFGDSKYQPVCKAIAAHFHIPLNYSGVPIWNYLLEKMYPNYHLSYTQNNYCTYFPIFNNLDQAEYFALSLQTEFLINIIDEVNESKISKLIF